jgi:lactate 2-monooxygenase
MLHDEQHGGLRSVPITNFADFQLGIYMKGLQGIRPGLPVTYAELERRAHNALDPALVSYVAGGAGDESTQDANVTAFDRWGLIPRMLVGAAERDLSVEFCAMTLPTPIFMAPIGVIGLCAQDGHGDLATARAAAATGIPMVASTLSVDPLEEVAPQFGDTPGLFQLYTPNDRELAESFVGRAEAAGFKGLVVTLANYTSDAVFREQLPVPPEEDMRAAALHWAGLFGNPTLSWADLPWLRSLTSMPLILKGLCHPDDVRRAIDGGADAVYCSTHGGRQANGGIGALDMLAGVVDAAGDVPVLFDSGVRSGDHIVKALALGATAVGIGRPYAWGLALGGAGGIEHVLRCLLAEADLLMAVDGYPTLADLDRAALLRLG